MGLNLGNLGKKITDVLGGVERQINPFDNGKTYNNPVGNVQPASTPVTQSINQTTGFNQPAPISTPNNYGNPISGSLQAIGSQIHGLTQPIINTQPINVINNAGIQGLQTANQILTRANIHPNIPVVSPVTDFLNTNITQPFIKGAGNINQLSRGNNPYTGSMPQQVGQLGTDVLNTAGLAIGGGEVGAGMKGASLGIRALRGAKVGAKTGALFGGAQGATQSLANGDNIGQGLINTGAGAVVGGVLGGAGGAALPVVGAGIKTGARGATRVVSALDERGAVRLPDSSGTKPSVKLKTPNVVQSTSFVPTEEELAMGKVLGMTPEQVKQAKIDLLTPQIFKPSPAIEIKLKNKQASIKAGAPVGLENSPAPITLPSAELGNPRQAVQNARAVKSLINDRAKPAIDAANSLSVHDHALLDETRVTSPIELAKRAENPTAFLDAANKAKVYTDYVHALGTGQGQLLGYRQQYGAPLLYNLDHAPTAEAISQTQAKLKKNPGYAKNRLTGVYDPTLERLNKNFAQDIQHDAGVRSSHIAELSLARGLSEAYPGQVAIGNIPRGYTQLQITGGKTISMPDAIAKELNKRANAPKVDNLALRGYDALNRGAKYTQLGGGTFHGVTTALTTGGQQLASGNIITHPLQNLRLVADTLSNKAFNATQAKFASTVHADGLSSLDRQKLAGVTLSPKEILGDANLSYFDKAGSVLRKNPVNYIIDKTHDMVFARQIPAAKQMIFEQATKGLDTRNPADLAKMRQVASAVNNLGGINRAVEGLTPKTAQNLSRGILATDFTETKFRKLGDALSKGGPQGKIARQMVIGKVIVAAIPGLVVAANQGKLNSTQDWVDETIKQITDPQVATGFKSSKGYAKVAKLPNTEISELTRVLTPLFDGSSDKLSGVKNYVSGRTAAGPSTIWQLMTNQDYFGNPIIAQDQNGKVDVGKTALNLASSKGPIPIAQGVKVAQGKQSLGEGIVNTLGARVVVDKNDPNYKKVQEYFNTRDAFTKSLNPNEQTLFNQVNPVKKDANGNNISVPKNTLTSPAHYDALLANPDFLAKYQQYQQSQKSHDPLWDLNPSQLRSYMQAQVISKNDPGGDSKTVRKLYERIPKDFFDTRTKYFDGLKAQGVTLPDSGTSKKTQMPDNLVKFSSDYHNLPYGTGARSAALRSPEGQAYIKYLNDNRIYNNQERADLGLPPLDAPASSQYSSGYSKRSQNTREYALSIGAGGKVSAPKVSVKKMAVGKSKAKVALSKPKVVIKKSLV